MGSKGSGIAAQVTCIETGITYESISEAAEKTGIHRSCISDQLRGRTTRCGKYHFRREQPIPGLEEEEEPVPVYSVSEVVTWEGDRVKVTGNHMCPKLPPNVKGTVSGVHLCDRHPITVRGDNGQVYYCLPSEVRKIWRGEYK